MEKSCNPVLTLGGRVSQGTTLGILAVAVVGAGLVFGWSSLVALGLSSIVISLLPCLAMCAVGICASRMGKKDAAGASTPAVPPKDADPATATASAVTATAAEEK